MKYANDNRVVMTLDAGGTNFVFSAIQANKEIIDPIRLPSNAHELDVCLNNIIEGFNLVKKELKEEPVAISFAFPGPADYPNGIIGNLPNLPAFRGGGVALGPMLEEKFGVPVFINNDGHLYAYGEGTSGFLPYVNEKLEAAGSPKKFENLIGVTLGTGFGIGIVHKGEMFLGANAGPEAWNMSTKYNNNCNAEEEGVAIRAVQRKYAEITGTNEDAQLTPKDIFEIGIGEKEGNQEAAKDAFAHMGRVVGDALANISALFDGIIVIGGGVSGARSLIIPAMLEEMRSKWTTYNNHSFQRLSQNVFNLEDQEDLSTFLKGDSQTIKVPGSDKTIVYDPMARVGIGFSQIGASTAIALGAYSFALNALDSKK